MVIVMINSNESHVDSSDGVVATYGNGVGYLDITDRVQCYQKGKVWSCDCGQDIGVHLDRRLVICATCNKPNIDMRWAEREPKEPEAKQAGLGEFL